MKVVAKFFAVEPEEAPRVGWLFVHSLCVGLFVAFFFSAANAIFLGHYGAKMLPWAYVASGLFGAVVVRVFKELRHRMAFTSLLFSQLGFLVTMVGGLYLLGSLLPGSSRKVVAFALFLVVGPALTVINLEFWGLTRRLFNVRQSKRFNPLVATGETMASIVGFFLVPLLRLEDTIHLLIPSLFGLFGSMAILAILRRRFATELQDHPPTDGVTPGRATKRHEEAPRDRYFALTAAVMGLVVVCQYLVDYSFLTELKKEYTSPEQLAAFIGVFYGAVKVLDLLMKSFVSGRLVQHFGLRLALRVLPSALLISTILALVLGARAKMLFLLVALTKLLWPVLRKSVFDPAFKVLYQPLPEAQSQGLQSSIDGSVRQVGTFLVGLLLLALNSAEVGPRALLVGLAVVLVAWIALIGPLHREYRRRLVDTLARRQPSPLVRPPFVELRQRLDDAQADERQSARDLLTGLDPALLAAIDGGQDISDLQRLEKTFARQDDRDLRCRILQLYALSGSAQAESLLVEKLSFPDKAVRHTALQGLITHGYRARGETAIQLHDSIEHLASDIAWNTAALVDLQQEPDSQNVSLSAVRQALREEIEEQRQNVFRRLALLYDQRAISLVRDSLTSDEDSGESAANALELLENLIAEELRPLVFPLVEDLPPATVLKQLGRFFPSQHLGWRERLGALVQRDPSRISTRVRALALEAIAVSCEKGEVAEELVAHLFHADPLLQELAAAAIGRLDREQLHLRLTKLPFAVHKRLRWAANSSMKPLAGPRTVLDRIRLLDRLEVVGELPRHVKRALAMSFEPRVLQPGDAWGANEPDHSMAVITTPSAETDGPLLLCAPGIEPFRPGVESHLLCIDGARVRDLLTRHAELLLAVLEICRQRRPQPAQKRRFDLANSSPKSVPSELALPTVAAA